MSDLDFSSPFERQSVLLTEAPENEGGNADPNAPEEGFEQAPDDANAAGEEQTADNTANEDNDDFTIDASDDGVDDTGAGGDAGGDTGGGEGGNSPETQNVDVDNAAKKKDREIFDSLSPQEQKIKTVKLKELFMELYDRCDQIMEKYNDLGASYEDLGVPVHRSVEALYSLKKMISTYLLYLFDSKSYIENDIQFNRFLTALNQIKVITKDMRDAHKDEIDVDDSEE